MGDYSMETSTKTLMLCSAAEKILVIPGDDALGAYIVGGLKRSPDEEGWIARLSGSASSIYRRN